MNELFLGIITNPAFPIITGMAGYLIGNYFALGRDKRKEFIAAAQELRKVFAPFILQLSNPIPHMLPTPDSGMIESQYTAIMNFKPYIKHRQTKNYEQAWSNYYARYNDFCCFGRNDEMAHFEILHDINEILKYTN